MGRWWATLPQERWPHGEEFEAMLKKHWTDEYGDRRQEIVFIGLSAEMNKQVIMDELDSCLITGFASNQDQYANMNDPFPQWFAA